MNQALVIGTRVRLVHDVDRYPHFIAERGSHGSVTHNDGDTICVRMDDLIVGAEEWDNEVVWRVRDGDDPSDDIEEI